MTKIRVNSFELKSNKILNEMKALVLSDIHNDGKNLDAILRRVESIKPDYICVPGDSLDYVNSDHKPILQFYKSATNLTNKIVVCSGNHDELNLVKRRFFGTKFVPAEENTFFEELDDIQSVIVLNDVVCQCIEEINGNKVNFGAINMPPRWYEGRKQKKEDFYIVTSRIEPDFFDENYFTYLLTHSSNPLVKWNKLVTEKQMPFMKNVDVIVSGHNHGGLMPKAWQPYIPMNMGFIGPGMMHPFKHAFGYWENETTALILSDGVTKLAPSTGLLYKLNDKFASDIEEITIKPSEGSSNQKQLVLKNRYVYETDK
ncbi:MAG: metallophosphoesterase [Bacilli bacterium]|nr:metallophosphoesterase [Bacilli bacterium]